MERTDGDAHSIFRRALNSYPAVRNLQVGCGRDTIDHKT